MSTADKYWWKFVDRSRKVLECTNFASQVLKLWPKAEKKDLKKGAHPRSPHS